jgi:hypothetical protein
MSVRAPVCIISYLYYRNAVMKKRTVLIAGFFCGAVTTMIIKIDPVYAGVRQVYTVRNIHFIRSRYVHPKKLSVHQANGYRMLTRQFFLITIFYYRRYATSLFSTIEGMQQQAQVNKPKPKLKLKHRLHRPKHKLKKLNKHRLRLKRILCKK